MTSLQCQNLTVRYGSGHSLMTAVDGVNLIVRDGGVLGIVGESGSGKSTIARAIVGLVKVASGCVLLDEQDVTNARGRRLALLRKHVQMVFQDPYSSLNPRATVGEAIAEAIRAHRKLHSRERRQEVGRLLDLVGLDADSAARYPHEFSGGQRQRVAIARSLAANPRMVILDEVTSALDVSVQATILNLLRALQAELRLSYICISHDLSVVRYMSDQVSVLYLGRVVETAAGHELFGQAEHPYTQALVDAIPQLRSRPAGRLYLSSEIPDPRHPPSGCRFHPRCPIGPVAHPERRICIDVDPNSLITDQAHAVACHFPLRRGDMEKLQLSEGAGVR